MGDFRGLICGMWRENNEENRQVVVGICQIILTRAMTTLFNISCAVVDPFQVQIYSAQFVAVCTARPSLSPVLNNTKGIHMQPPSHRKLQKPLKLNVFCSETCSFDQFCFSCWLELCLRTVKELWLLAKKRFNMKKAGLGALSTHCFFFPFIAAYMTLKMWS